jgi:hypothetical protein
MLHEPFGEHSLSWTVVFEWHSRFKVSWVSAEDDCQLSGRPSTRRMTENVDKIWELIHEDHRWTIHELADTVGISYGVCQEILTKNLNVRHIATKFVPQLLTIDQKKWRVNVCLKIWEKANVDQTFMFRIIMADESWIYGYNPQTKQQSSQWKSPESPWAKKARQVQSSRKSMLIVFLDAKGIVHHEFVPPNNTVNWLLLWRFEMLERKCVTKKKDRHFGTSTTGSFIMTTRPWKPQFVTNNNMVIIPHPPYSLDFAPCDFALFPKLKMKLKGWCFETVSEIQGNHKRYSTALRQITSTVLLKRGKNDGIAIYIPKEPILKEMAAKIE